MRRYLTVSLAITALALPSGTAVGDDSLGRNRSLEAAVVQHLIEQGFGRTNQITVLGPGDEAGPFEGTPDLSTNLSRQRPTSGFSDRPYDYRWAQSSRDRGSQREIAMRLQEAIPSGRDLYALVQNEQAFLFGRVPNQQQRQLAEEIAQSVKGIDQVRNQLVVAQQGRPERDDSRIEEAIRDNLSGSLFVDAGRIRVDVGEGIAVLSGTVDSFSELVVVVESAFHGGARTVRSQLQIIERSDQREQGSTTGGQPPNGLNRDP